MDDAGAAYPLTIDPLFATEEARLFASVPAADDRFGTSVAISGNTVVVGAPFDNTAAGSDAGSVYVFVRSGTTWSQQAQLFAADAATSDQFGTAVSISGDTVVVGSPFDNWAAGSDAGSAYVFLRSGTTWTQQARLTASDPDADDRFGTSVAIATNTVVVGAPLNDFPTTDSGSIYAFLRSGTTWSQQARLVASDAATNSQFGSSVAVEANTAVAGAPLDNSPTKSDSGAAYVFFRSGTSWNEQAQLSASDAESDDHFGASVAISGETAVVGAPLDDNGFFVSANAGSAYVYVRSGTTWTQETQLVASDFIRAGDEFAATVAISGNTVAVGGRLHDASSNGDSGAAWVFVRVGTTWTQEAKLLASDPFSVGDQFGTSVAVDGATVVAGAPFDGPDPETDTGSAYVSRLDDESYSIADPPPVLEGDSGTQLATFTITRSGNTAGTSSVNWATADDSAQAFNGDYVAVPPTTLTFTAGEISKTVSVTVNGDTEVEYNGTWSETFFVKLSSPVSAAIGAGTATGMINDDDDYVVIGDDIVPEGNSGTTQVNLNLSRTGSALGSSSVTWATANGTATAGSDYVAGGPTTVTFAAGETLKTVTVTLNGDTAVEADETFTVNLSAPVGATIGDGSGTVTITNDDIGPTTLSIGDTTVVEGNSGTKMATFTITRSGDTSGTPSVNWATSNNTAAAGSDYVAVAATTVSFAVGETSKTVSVTVNGDTAVEANETFYVSLSAPVGATLGDWYGYGTISNDDAATFSISNAAVTEGNSGTTPANFTITRAGAVAGPATVKWATSNNTATAGSDYLAVAATTVNFAGGETSKTVSVSVNGDTAVEANETFYVSLSAATNATLADWYAVATITNNDAATFAISNGSVTEGNSGTALATFTISRSGAVAGPATVKWATSNNTATAGSDYLAVAATTVNFGGGETSKTVSVSVNGDTAVEANETFYASLSAPTFATLGDWYGFGTITNDDAATFAISNATVTEGNSGTKLATFTITRSGAVAGSATVKWATSNNTATAGTDYVAVAATTVSFAPGETSKMVSVTINGDTVVEANETFYASLSAPTFATLGDWYGVGTITNDD